MHTPADIIASKHGCISTSSEGGVDVGLSDLFFQCGAVIQRAPVTTDRLPDEKELGKNRTTSGRGV